LRLGTRGFHPGLRSDGPPAAERSIGWESVSTRVYAGLESVWESRASENVIWRTSPVSNSYTDLHYHIVFSTKRREPTIVPSLRDRLYRFLGGLTRKRRGILLACGGIADHVHLLVRLRPDTPVSQFVRAIKTSSSGWINQKRLTSSRFHWQTGYSAFTVSRSVLPSVTQYIQDQAEHHRHRTFTEELDALLTRHRFPTSR